jgi:chemosensory pili system protein ChpA (sensor histidine kinase/response regulator)
MTSRRSSSPLLKNLDDADAALLAQARLSRDVQQRLFSIRTTPFGSLSERLYRIMRATAKELDKRANLEIHGGQVELDRSVLEKLVGPLEHLLRNALDHGIESREARSNSGKSETGEIDLTVRQVGNEVVIEIADDGAGIDYARVRERAVAQGLIAADASPTEAQLVECLFQPGFSTAAKITQISGRGIGMDVVRSEIAALGGRVEVMATPGRGTRFVLTLPLTLAVAQAVMVRAGGRLWALPAPMVEQVQQLKSQALLDIYIQRKVEWQGRTYPFHYLPRLLGDTAHNPETKRYNSILLLRSGQNHAAVHVDEMVGNQEVVVKNIGPATGPGVRHFGRDGARYRRNRADHQPRAIGRPRRRSEIRSNDRSRAGRSPARARGPGVHATAGDDRRRLADGAQDHEPPCSSARALRSQRRRTAWMRCSC